MDGTNRGTLINATVKEHAPDVPRSLTIDYREKKLYWCDPNFFRIHRIGLDGSDHEILLHSNINFVPFSMAYHNQYVFWYDTSNDSIRRMHVNTSNVKVIPE